MPNPEHSSSKKERERESCSCSGRGPDSPAFSLVHCTRDEIMLLKMGGVGVACWLGDLPDSSKHPVATGRWLPTVLWKPELRSMLTPACHLSSSRTLPAFSSWLEATLPGRGKACPPRPVGSPHHHTKMAFPLPASVSTGVSFLFLLQSPGDWYNLLDEEELKGVSMATVGPAPYLSV